MKRVLFYCQHVLGMGHLVRSIEILRGLSGFEVCFINGGELPEGIELPPNVRTVNLPVLQSDEEFREIHAAPGLDIEDVKNQRLATLLETVADFRPDIAVIELFPFGRRKFAFELIPMLEEIRRRSTSAKIICSLRDIVVSKQDCERYEKKVRAILDRYFDLVLVHSDPQFQRLEESFLSAAEIRCPVRYTGFIVRRPEPGPNAPENCTGTARIVASIGGGRVGGELLEAVIAASAQLKSSCPHQVEIFTGPFLSEERFARLMTLAVPNGAVKLARFTPSLPLRLQQADLSISMAGYNTCMDLVVAGVPALLYPFTGGDNQEQTTRAQKLQALGVATVLNSADLAPDRLAGKIRSNLARKAPKIGLDIEGVNHTATVLHELAETP